MQTRIFSEFTRRSRTKKAVAVLLTGVVLAAAGCSSSGKGSTPTGPAASVDAAALQNAQTYLQQFLQAPTIANLPALTQKPTGKTFVMVGGLASPVFTNYDLGVHQACEVLGCIVNDLGAATTTAQQSAAYHAILSIHPAVAILYNFNQDSLRSPVLTQIAESGTKVLTITGEPSTTGPNLPYNIQTNDEKKIEGKILASWVATNSKCKGNVLVPFTPATAASVAFTNSFSTELPAICPSMNVRQLPVLPADIGTKIPGQIVATIQAHPEINYLVGPCPIMTGTNQALVRAGLSGKVIGADDVGTMLCDKELQDSSSYLKAVLDLGYLYSGWNIVGAGAYLLSGQTPSSQVFNGVSYPMILHTSYTPGGSEYDDKGNWVGDNQGYQSAFKTAWGVTG